MGIGGAYLCIYGMEGPGGYQFVGRTLQMWNRYRTTEHFEPGKPWLLRFFDQVRFYEVSSDELKQIRRDFPNGDYPIRIEETRFNLKDYEGFLAENERKSATSRPTASRPSMRSCNAGSSPARSTSAPKRPLRTPVKTTPPTCRPASTRWKATWPATFGNAW